MHRCAEYLVRMLPGNVELAAMDVCFGITEACTDGLIVRQASVAGGSGARCAPGGEREGRSRLASRRITPRQQQGARGAKPPHSHIISMRSSRKREDRSARMVIW